MLFVANASRIGGTGYAAHCFFFSIEKIKTTFNPSYTPLTGTSDKRKSKELPCPHTKRHGQKIKPQAILT